jgi:hypothetical protein
LAAKFGANMNSHSRQTFYERVAKLAHLLFKTGSQKNQSPNRRLPVFAPKAASFKQHLPSWLLMFEKSWYSLSDFASRPNLFFEKCSFNSRGMRNDCA